MTKYVYSYSGKPIRQEESAPLCGEAFCERCGDCLYCYDTDECSAPTGGPHVWVEYEDDV